MREKKERKNKAKTNSIGQRVSLLLCNCYRIIHTIKINQVKDGPKFMSKFTVCFYVLVVVMGPVVQHYSKIEHVLINNNNLNITMLSLLLL